MHAAANAAEIPFADMSSAMPMKWLGQRFGFEERLLRRLHRADEDERHAVARPRVRADPVQPSHAVVAPRRPRERELLEVVREAEDRASPQPVRVAPPGRRAHALVDDEKNIV